MRHYVLAGLLLSALAAGPAGGTPRAAGQPGGAAVAAFVEAWVAGARAQAAEQGVTSVQPVGDVDGDGGSDLAVTTSRDQGEQLGELALTVRRGATGKELWRYVVRAGEPCDKDCAEGELQFADAWPARLAGGRAGFLVHRWFTSTTPDGTTLTHDLRGLDHTGAETWRVVRSGSVTESAGTVRADEVPVIRLLFDGLAGPADDLLTGARSSEYPAGASREDVAWHEDLALVDGGTGEVADAGYRDTTEPADHGYRDLVAIRALPDVSGDGRDDYAVQYAGAGSLAAYQGSDGTELWHRAGGWWLVPTLPGDLTGDGLADLVLESVQTEHPVAELVDGATGTTVWRRASDSAWVGRGEVWLTRLETSDTTQHAVAEAVAGDGTVLRTVERTYRLPAGTRLRADETFTGGLFPVSEVTSDGTVDLYYSVSVYRSSTPPDLRYLSQAMVDGRTGRTLWTGPGAVPLEGSLDGDGDDAAGVVAGRNGLTVTARAGDTGRALWSAVVPGRYEGGSTEIGRFGTGARAGLLVQAWVDIDRAAAPSRVVLYGSGGRVLWYADLGSVGAPPPADARSGERVATRRVTRAGRLPATGYAVPPAAWLAVLPLLAIVRRRRTS